MLYRGSHIVAWGSVKHMPLFGNPRRLGLLATMYRLVIIAVLTLSVASDKTSAAPLVGATGPAVYVWRQSVKGDWQAASSWTPARSTPAPSDILLFNIGGTMTATNVPTEAIAQLIVSETVRCLPRQKALPVTRSARLISTRLSLTTVLGTSPSLVPIRSGQPRQPQ